MLQGNLKILIIIYITILLFSSCTKKATVTNGFLKTSYNEIIARDTLVVVPASNSIDYFIYRGKPMGFQLELLTEFAEYLGVELTVVVENNIYKSMAMLMTGRCDMLAMSDLSCMPRQGFIGYSYPLAMSRLVLVQNSSNKIISKPNDLNGETIFLAESEYISNIFKEAADKWQIDANPIIIDSLDPEQILEGISKREYKYSIVRENLALLYSNVLNIKTGLIVADSIAVNWALPASSSQLLDTLNKWIEITGETNLFRAKYNKYYRHSYGEFSIDYSEYMTNKGNISPFDDIIKLQSKKIGWDWRLLASLIYQESKFNPLATSWAGAYGIMQLMPQTAILYGIDENSNVDEHIAAGVEFIKIIEENVPENVCDTLDRICFTLAAYNVGYSHVNDAILLTKKYGRDGNDWNEVSTSLIHLSDPKFYTDSVVSSGYCPGRLTVSFVNDIFERYRHYCNIVPE